MAALHEPLLLPALTMQPPQPLKPVSKAAQLALESEAAIGKDLENIIHRALHAVNTRDFSPTSPAWSSFSPSFQNDPDGPAFQQFIASQYHLPTSSIKKPKSLQEFLAVHQTSSERNPKYCLKAVELHTTMVNEKAGYAQVIMAGEATGMPEGVVRRTISAFEFRFIGGKWWCVNTRTLPGMDASTGPSDFY